MNVLGHRNLDQLITDDTWSRVINGVCSESRIDHLYTTRSKNISNLKLVSNAYSDHMMIKFAVHVKPESVDSGYVWKRNWFNYSGERLKEELQNENWNIETNNPQAYYYILENKIINIIDRLAPLKKYSNRWGTVA